MKNASIDNYSKWILVFKKTYRRILDFIMYYKTKITLFLYECYTKIENIMYSNCFRSYQCLNIDQYSVYQPVLHVINS